MNKKYSKRQTEMKELNRELPDWFKTDKKTTITQIKTLYKITQKSISNEQHSNP